MADAGWRDNGAAAVSNVLLAGTVSCMRLSFSSSTLTRKRREMVRSLSMVHVM